jgi:hypothetical protein
MLLMFRVGVCLILLSLNFSVQAVYCNDIGEDFDRLACFDRLAVCRRVSSVNARLDCYDRAAINSKPASYLSTAPETLAVNPDVVNPVVVNSAPSPQVSKEMRAPKISSDDKAANAEFGLPTKKPETANQISTRIKGVFDGFQAKQIFKLENGQIWQMRRNMGIRKFSAVERPEVTINANLLGFYVMSISGVKFKLPVKRLE